MTAPLKVLIFGAAWCGGCKVLKQALEGQDLPGVAIEHIDADASPDVVNRYGVRSLPTVVIPDKGIVRTGVTSLPAFRKLLQDAEG